MDGREGGEGGREEEEGGRGILGRKGNYND